MPFSESDLAPSQVRIKQQDNAIQSDLQQGVPRRTHRVLMIAPTSFFADYGCHVRILEEALVLRQLGNQVIICTYHNGRDIADLEIQRTMAIPWRTDYEVGSSRHKIAFDALLQVKALSAATRFRPDVVHGHLHEGALIGYTVSKLLGVPLVFDFQGSMTSEMTDHGFLNPDGPFFGPARWLEQRIVELPAAIITSSHHAAGLLSNDFHCPPDKVTAITDCVNADFFAPLQSRAECFRLKERLGIPSNRQVVVYLGLLAEWQGTGLLIQAAARLIADMPDVHFLIMGFPSVEEYRQQAVNLGLGGHVTFTGKIPYEQAPNHLALGDVAVAPKISATEGSGKLLNYMAMGLPSVAFDVPVSREFLGELGVYAQHGDAASLADAVHILLSNPKGARARGQALRKRAVERFSWANAGVKLMDIYQRLLR
jgi:glycosyltransferase involved in cell wall biosynthesis